MAARPRSAAARKLHAAVILDRLLKEYPGAHCALDFTNAYELLAATILSAQCTDKRVNMVTPTAFGRNDGIVVDTHVTRLSNRLGLAKGTDAVKLEQALIPLFPQEYWTMISHLLIEHGRQVCDARAPRCGACILSDVCPSALT
jgi:endonuclease III